MKPEAGNKILYKDGDDVFEGYVLDENERYHHCLAVLLGRRLEQDKNTCLVKPTHYLGRDMRIIVPYAHIIDITKGKAK